MARTVALAALLFVCAASRVHADRVHLTDGAVIEGVARREGPKVIIELESGRISLPVESVARIEASATPVQTYEARLSKLVRDDVKGLLALSGFCRDHGMTQHERELLARILEIEPDHAEARARLGYVRVDGVWITRDEESRRKGLVSYRGQWVTRAELLELERLEAETEAARLEREKAALELEGKRVELAQRREEAQRERQRAEAEEQARGEAQRRTSSYALYYPFAGRHVGIGAGCTLGPSCPGKPSNMPAQPAPDAAPTPWNINGVRDPRDMGWSMPGVREPRSYF